MDMWGKYKIGRMETRPGEELMSMNMSVAPTIDMFLSLPNGTEIFGIEIGLLGIEVKAMGIVIDDNVRDDIRKWAEATGSTNTPFSLLVYVLPKDMEIPSDLGEVLNGGYVKLGFRHGSEGLPMFSEALLRERYSTAWNDESYAAYITAYNKGAQHRKGH